MKQFLVGIVAIVVMLLWYLLMIAVWALPFTILFLIARWIFS